MDQPLSAIAARKLAKEIVQSGDVAFSRHAEIRMLENGLSSIDVINVLHRAFTQRIAVVIEFSKPKSSWS